MRDLIFKTAAEIEGVGPLKETLKWSEPAYLTEATGSGSTIRLGWFRSSERESAVLFNCRTTLVDNFRVQFPNAFAYEKNRAILLDVRERLPKAPLSVCLGMALTYHRRRQGFLLCDAKLVVRGLFIKARQHVARGRRNDRCLPIRTREGFHRVP